MKPKYSDRIMAERYFFACMTFYAKFSKIPLKFIKMFFKTQLYFQGFFNSKDKSTWTTKEISTEQLRYYANHMLSHIEGLKIEVDLLRLYGYDFIIQCRKEYEESHKNLH